MDFPCPFCGAGTRATDRKIPPGRRPASGRCQVPRAEAPGLAPNEDESDRAEDDAAESPTTAPTETSGDIHQPSALSRRAGDDEKFKILKSLWEQYMAEDWDRYLEDEWRHAPERDQLRFIKEVFGCSVRMAGKNRSHH
jgi:hypothetical protein